MTSRTDNQEDGARRLAETEGLLEDSERWRSEEDLGKLAGADELAETERRLAQRVKEQMAVQEVATAGELAAKDTKAVERLAEMKWRLAKREEEHTAALGEVHLRKDLLP